MADDKRLERVELKIDLISDRLGNIDSTLSAQHVTLKEHSRRSTALEAIVDSLRRRVTMAEGALALLGVIATVLAMYKILK